MHRLPARARIILLTIAAALALLLRPTIAAAGWAEPAWPFRYPLNVTWDAEHTTGDELATAEFYTAGHAAPDGHDFRLSTADADPLPCQVLMLGPGDRARIIFPLRKNVRDYDLYFGNPAAPPPPPNLAHVRITSGLQMETRQWTGGPLNSFDDFVQSWQRSRPVLGTAMIDAAFLGYNPFGDQDRTISKITGTFYAPLNGNYLFAMSVDDDGALYIDNQPLLRAAFGPSDTRYHAETALAPGPHDFLLYHVNTGGAMRFTVAWRRPDSAVMQVMGRGAFGTCFGSVPGPLEMRDHPLLAGFTVQQVGECFVNDIDDYVFCYRFTSTAHAESPIRYQWNFGDGQATSADAGAVVDHVYFHAGVFPVTLSIAVGPNGDAQTSRIAIQRNYLHLLNTVELEPAALCKLIGNDHPSAMSATDLARAAALYLSADDLDGALRAATALAAAPVREDPNTDLTVLEAVSTQLIDHGRIDDALAMWRRVAPAGRMGVRAAMAAADIALWWRGDPQQALALLATAPSGAPDTQALYARALLLSGKPADATPILLRLEPPQNPARHVALAGAAARSVEFYLTEKDPAAGEDAWDQWQLRYPADFLQGYSALLRVRLMELRHCPLAAASVAEDFARAMPQSSYAPQLLDLASKLLAASDPAKSRALRALLKQRYPEDPLSQP